VIDLGNELSTVANAVTGCSLVYCVSVITSTLFRHRVDYYCELFLTHWYGTSDAELTNEQVIIPE